MVLVYILTTLYLSPSYSNNMEKLYNMQKYKNKLKFESITTDFTQLLLLPFSTFWNLNEIFKL